jgi:hypothetical protein
MTEQTKKQLTDEEMNELVIADVNDPSAWGEPIVVGPSKGPRRIRRAKHLELASKFYILSVLHRLGADATLTFSQTDNVDITVVLGSGNALTVDIKTLTGPMEWSVADFSARANHFVAFVWYPDYVEPNVPPTVYIVSSEQLRTFIAEHKSASVSLPRLDEEIQARNAWQRLAVPAAA